MDFGNVKKVAKRIVAATEREAALDWDALWSQFKRKLGLEKSPPTAEQYRLMMESMLQAGERFTDALQSAAGKAEERGHRQMEQATERVDRSIGRP